MGKEKDHDMEIGMYVGTRNNVENSLIWGSKSKNLVQDVVLLSGMVFDKKR